MVCGLQNRCGADKRCPGWVRFPRVPEFYCRQSGKRIRSVRAALPQPYMHAQKLHVELLLMRIRKSVASVFASAFALIQLTGSMLPVLPVQAKAPVSAGRAKAPIWSNNIKVPYRSWLPRTKPKEILLCVHGLDRKSVV